MKNMLVEQEWSLLIINVYWFTSKSNFAGTILIRLDTAGRCYREVVAFVVVDIVYCIYTDMYGID